ncbi:MAG: hypothetical protein ACREQM_22625 [Candidatus Dormibacteraceae bacterium]
MTPAEAWERELSRLFRQNAIQPLNQPAAVARQQFDLAVRNYERALREIDSAFEDRDLDSPFLRLYQALRCSASALLAAYGYRVPGSEGGHRETLRLGALALTVTEPIAARTLEEIREPARVARNRAEYAAVDTVMERDLARLFEGLATVIPAVARSLRTVLPDHDFPSGELPLPGRFDTPETNA